MNYPSFRRRRFMVMPRFQIGVALRVSFFVLLYSAALGFLIFFPMQRELTAVAPLDKQALIADQILELHYRVWPGIVLVGILVGLHTIFTSHRIAGPIYRIDQVIRKIAAGDYSQRIRLRRTDGWQEFAEAVNALGEQLDRRRSDSLLVFRQAQDMLEKAQEDSVPKEVRNRLKEVLRVLQQADGHLDIGDQQGRTSHGPAAEVVIKSKSGKGLATPTH
ncbi:MAG: hypothetical protein ACE5K9_07215 [Candidatus Methylomirabilales bacterium]